jgi:putative tricarboxylic transport membrane protein
MFASVLDGFVLVFQWPSIGFLLLGTLIGLWLGAVPGLAGVTGMVLVLPFTFGMEPVSALVLLIAIHAVVSTSDTITAVMLGVPGTAAAQATVLDGHPLAKQGHAARAFGAAFTCSAAGGLIGAFVMAVSLPLALPIILSFGSPEFFILGVLGLTMVGTVSGKAVAKGLGAALLGLLVSQVGYPVASETPRYWFDLPYLLDGFALIPVVLGVFALPELLELAVRNKSISDVPPQQASGLMDGVRDAVRHWRLVLRSSAIGVYIGVLPGLGSAIVDWIAYGDVVRRTKAKDNPRFGQGDIRGVIAPEAANNAIKGGDLIPTVAIGIPGSAAMAVLLSALLIQGLQPGREMLTTKLNITYSMVWTLVIANLLGAGLLMLWSRQVAKASFINGHLIVPGVALLMFMGAWLSSPDIGSWITFLGFGVLGYLMKRAGWPRPALILGYVLGPIMEKALILSVQAFSPVDLLTRPVFLVLILVTIFVFYTTVRTTANFTIDADKSEEIGATRFLSLLFAAGVLCVFAAAIPPALGWSMSGKLFPLVTSSIAIVVVSIVVISGARSECSRAWARRYKAGAGGRSSGAGPRSSLSTGRSSRPCGRARTAR